MDYGSEAGFGGEEREITSFEAAFLAALEQPPFISVWLYTDRDDTPWMIVAMDFIVDGAVRDTLRLDVDEHHILGGWSPSFLNGDACVRAREANVDVDSEDGLVLAGATAEQAARAAHRWFANHADAWRRGPACGPVELARRSLATQDVAEALGVPEAACERFGRLRSMHGLHDPWRLLVVIAAASWRRADRPRGL